ncbi:MAG: hypothetical protein JW702_03860 [Clostridiales bacterium]|nr:hypothetical protein [Clostridiales bacterium]
MGTAIVYMNTFILLATLFVGVYLIILMVKLARRGIIALDYYNSEKKNRN